MTEQTIPPVEELLPEYWGFFDGTFMYDGGFRAPLPPNEQFPTVERECGNINGHTRLMHPPYIVARHYKREDHVEVLLCDATGCRAGYGTDPSGYAAEAIYTDSDHMPEEWKEPVARAMEEIRSLWPDAQIVATRQETDAFWERNTGVL